MDHLTLLVLSILIASINADSATTNVQNEAATIGDGQAQGVGYAYSTQQPGISQAAGFMSGYAYSQYGSAYTSGETNSHASGNGVTADTHTSQVLSTNGNGYAQGISQAESITVGSNQANYAGSAAVAFGDASASEQATAGTATAGAKAG